MWTLGVREHISEKEIQDKRARVCEDMMIEFRDQIKFDTRAEYCEWDRRKLSDYNLQQFWNYVQTKKCFKI